LIPVLKILHEELVQSYLTMDYTTPPTSPRGPINPPNAPLRPNMVIHPQTALNTGGFMAYLNVQGPPVLPGHVFPPMGPASQQP
jgi:hypothetical protein